MGFVTKCFSCKQGDLMVVKELPEKEEIKVVCKDCKAGFFISLKEDKE